MAQPRDMTLLPNLDRMHAWVCIDDDTTVRLAALPRASDRIQNALKFLWFSGNTDTTSYVRESDARRIREGFLRATLAELVSVEEILPLDIAELKLAAGAPKMNDDRLGPHVHFVRELRNHELHLHHNRLVEFKRDLLWGNPDKPDDAHPTTFSLWSLNSITVESFSALKNSKYFTTSEISSIISWFNTTQSEWGIHEIILLAIQDYAALICNLLLPKPAGLPNLTFERDRSEAASPSI